MPANSMSCAAIFLLWQSFSLAVAAPLSTEVAALVDRAIAQDVFDENTALAPRSDDETFLRRVHLDLVGDIPSPEVITVFLLDPDTGKRARLVQKLLANPRYGENWARYWRDVVFYRSQEDRARIAANAMVADLARQFNNNTPWDQIATQFITARGDVKEKGHTAIIMAQDGRTNETAAEVSRIFLGIQIQCAQCHDHPTDRWNREQFHELAAFFPRIGVRNVRTMTKRSFEVYHNDRFRKKQRNDNDRRPSAEHRMDDLENPNLPGKVMQPKFFLTNASLPLGTRDAKRREQLAEWLTDNEWFAIAIVNRLWSELVGEGFYEPIDDIGPDREATAPAAVQLLANQFRSNGYNLKWLLATICQTDAYQRAALPRRLPNGTPMAANVPQRLRSDQLFNALFTALNVDERSLDPPGRLGNGGRQVSYRSRAAFADLFGYDPSELREGVSATIPQSLALMNSKTYNRYLLANKKNITRQLLTEIKDDESLVVELYLRCLSREPRDEELQKAMAYCGKIANRTKAFEDLFWALLNSAEFQYRR